jgi:hypothetical protein
MFTPTAAPAAPCATTRHLGTDDVVEWVRQVGLGQCIAQVAADRKSVV